MQPFGPLGVQMSVGLLIFRLKHAHCFLAGNITTHSCGSELDIDPLYKHMGIPCIKKRRLSMHDARKNSIHSRPTMEWKIVKIKSS